MCQLTGQLRELDHIFRVISSLGYTLIDRADGRLLVLHLPLSYPLLPPIPIVGKETPPFTASWGSILYSVL